MCGGSGALVREEVDSEKRGSVAGARSFMSSLSLSLSLACALWNFVFFRPSAIFVYTDRERKELSFSKTTV